MITRILFLSKSNDSASTRYRALQYFPLLQESGFAVAHAAIAGGPGDYLDALRRAATADIVVVLRKTFPIAMLWLLRQLSRKLVFDFDDAIFCNTDGSTSATRMRRFAAMAKASDHIFAGNGFLERNAKCFNTAITVIPTCVDARQYSSMAEKPSDMIDLVWIGSRSTRKYLLDALPALRLAANRLPRLRLKIIADFDLPDAGFPILARPLERGHRSKGIGLRAYRYCAAAERRLESRQVCPESPAVHGVGAAGHFLECRNQRRGGRQREYRLSRDKRCGVVRAHCRTGRQRELALPVGRRGAAASACQLLD